LDAASRMSAQTAAGPIVAAESNTHVTLALVINKADLAQHRLFLETLLAVAPSIGRRG
jgi:hypothetical protein